MANETVSVPAARRAGGQELARRFSALFGGVAGPLAGRRSFRLWGMLHHVGRKSGRAYATPLVTRRMPDGFVMPLPFGEGTQWVRNLLAAGSATIRWDGRDFPVVEPRIVKLAEVAHAFSGAERAILRRADMNLVRVLDSPAAP
jgi:deazaflavin-dependent oxidoreductase (nitroreductase family)